MIDYLEIQNYKMFERLRLDGLGRVNLIVGKNNVGKSSLLEAVFLAAAPDPIYAFVRIMEMRRINPGGYTLKNLTGFFGDPFTGLGTRVEGFDFSSKIEVDRERLLFRKSNQELAMPIDEDFRKSIADAKANPKSVLGALYVSSDGPDAWEVHNLWDFLDLYDRKSYILEALRIAMPEVQTVGVVSDGNAYRQPYATIAGSQAALALAALGEGMSRMFGISLGLGVTAKGVLCIDEVENGLHYELHERVCDFIFQVASKLDVQVFLTTHSLDFTRAFARAAHKSSELGRLYRLTRRLGYLEAVDYTEQEMLLAAEQEIEVR